MEKDDTICKWSVQKNKMCPYKEILNMLVNSFKHDKKRCEEKKCLLLEGIEAKKYLEEEAGYNDDYKLLKEVGKTSWVKPTGPADTTDLLNQFNIDEVLQDFSMASLNKDTHFINIPFYHIPFEMRDFAKSSTSTLNNLDFKSLINKKFKSFGCVLNTDVWAGPGKHWVCIFGTVDGKTINIEYFNSSSNGLSEFEEIAEWVDRKKKEFPKYKISIKEVVEEEIQKSETECGVWCLCYIKCRLENKPHNYFMKKNISDDEITQARKYLFFKN